MDTAVFNKMRVKRGTPGIFFYAPLDYQDMVKKQDIIDFDRSKKPKFIHLFVESIEDYENRIPEVLLLMDNDTRLWISYKKSKNKIKYNINRDSFFSLGQRDGLTPNANIRLDEEWSCIGFKKSLI
jgi:hypothetical protein